MTQAAADAQTTNPYAPPAEAAALRDDQFAISLEAYALIMSHNDVSRKSRRQTLVIGLLSLLVAGLFILLKQHWAVSMFAALFGIFLLKARFTGNLPHVKMLYDQLKLADKILTFQIKDAGILIHEGRSYGFIPAEEISRIDIIKDVAIIVRNNVGLQGIHLRNDAIRSVIQKFKLDHSL